MAQSRTEYSSGPIPNPEHLEKYESVLPGAADRIMGMAERQSAHRQDIEKKAVYSGSFRATLGVIVGGLLAAMIFAGGVTCILYGHEIGGTIITAVDIVALVGTFVYGTNSQKAERKEKKEASDKLIKK